MNSSYSVRRGTSQLTGMAILAALVIVLTVMCNFIKFGPFSITLALAPIIIGGAVLGVKCGTLLGFIFSLIVLITGIMGWDGGTVAYLVGMKPVISVFICMLKGTSAGFCAALVYSALEKKSRLLAVIAAGIVCPLVNTGVFVALMLVFFRDVFESWAGGQSMLLFIITGIAGINFLIELIVNMALSTGITRIIDTVKKKQA